MVNEITVKQEEIDAILTKDWTKSLDIVKSMLTKNLTNDEFKMFLYIAKQYDLNPIKREIYMIKYGDSAQTIISRDGYYELLRRKESYNGHETTLHLDEKFPDNTMNMWAECKVYLKGIEHPITEVAYFKESVNANNAIWNKMPKTMLRKVAESRAFRKACGAFGTYSEEELGEPVKETITGKEILSEIKEK
jgi:phage recombination protein Bet